MSKGQTVPCPACKEILIRFAKFDGIGTFETLCPHCEKLVLVTVGKKCLITVEILILLLIILGAFAIMPVDNSYEYTIDSEDIGTMIK